MRVRLLSVAAVGVLAVSGLSACRTNVGAAAVVDGHRVSENDVAKYLATSAQAVKVQDQSGATISIPARTFVLNTLIDQQLYQRILQATPTGVPNEGAIASATQQGLNGSTVEKVADQAGLHGYPGAFARLWVRVQVLRNAISTDAQKGVNVQTVIDKLHFPVSVNPRYGAWDTKSLSLSTNPAASVPDFLKPTGTSTAG
ncbi:MAG: hypothetical protein JWO57_1057 [Pseudonocardiales bacterium]|nr:hypothetical protein [Pseudonocardiales bacterium]